MNKVRHTEHFWIVIALILGWVMIQFLAPRPAAPT